MTAIPTCGVFDGASKVVFASDVHLTPAEPEVFVRFCRFLDETAKGAAALFLLGDVFDFWVGERQLEVPGYAEVFDRLAALRNSGTEVHFLEGNRDFLLGGEFARKRGIVVLPDLCSIRLGDRKVLLTHGDLLCTHDTAYLRMRKVIRSRPARAVMAGMPLGVALGIARGFRSASGRAIDEKPAYRMQPDFDLARRWLSGGYDALVFGHVHTGERYRLALPDREADVFVLGSWDDVPSYVEAGPDGLVLRAFEPG